MKVNRGDAVNLVRDLRPYGDNALKKITLNGLWCLFDAIENMDAALRASPGEAEGEDDARRLYYALDRACLMTGAWSNMSFADLPEHVIGQLLKVLEAVRDSSEEKDR